MWDEYIPNSLKATPRGKRGGGIRRRVNAVIQLSRDWNGFLLVDETKRSFSNFWLRKQLPWEVRSKSFPSLAQKLSVILRVVVSA